MIEPFMDIKAPSPPVDPPGDLKSVNSLVFVDNKLFNLRNSLATVSFSSCQRILIKTFQIEAIIALITKMAMIFS